MTTGIDRFIRTYLAACLMVVMAAFPVVAAEGGLQAHLIDRPSVGDLNVYGPAKRQVYIAAPEVPGRSAVRIEIGEPAAGGNLWDIGVGAVTTADIRKDDVVTAVFWARTDTPGAVISARLQGNDAPYTGLAQQDVTPDEQWRLYRIEGRSAEVYATGHAGLTLSLNTRAQVVDIGPVYIFSNSGNSDISINALKIMPLSGVVDATIDRPDGVKLVATLRTPAGEGPFPAVMELTGRGPWGRNPADPVAQALFKSGVAVLQFDKRGVGQSTGSLDNASHTDLTGDAAALVQWLRAQPGIDSRRTGLLGGSQGGAIAFSVAAADPRVAFVVSMAGPTVSMFELYVLQNELAMLEQGMDPAQVRAVSQMTREALAALAQATGDDDAVARVKAVLAPHVGKLITKADADATAEGARNPAARALMLYDPAAELKKIKVPVLGLFGSLDRQVPAEENAAALRKGLAGNPDVTIVIMPGFNHLFQHAKTGSVAEWGTLKEVGGSDPEFLKIITEWVAKRTGAAAP